MLVDCHTLTTSQHGRTEPTLRDTVHAIHLIAVQLTHAMPVYRCSQVGDLVRHMDDLAHYQ